jgi:hypothetical protein
MSLANLASNKMLMLESQKTTKMIRFVTNNKRFTCGVVEDRVRSLIGNKRGQLLLIKFRIDNYFFLSLQVTVISVGFG